MRNCVCVCVCVRARAYVSARKKHVSFRWKRAGIIIAYSSRHAANNERINL